MSPPLADRPDSQDKSNTTQTPSQNFNLDNIEHLETAFYDVMFGDSKTGDDQPNDIEKAVLDDIVVLMEHSSGLASLVPPLSQQLFEITTALENENTDFDHISHIIHKDVKLAGEVIKMANSPLYIRAGKPVDELSQAIPLLGLDGITNLATTVLAQRVIDIKPIYFKLFGKLIWTHSLECAIACRHLAGETNPCQAYFLGLIHDVGKVVMFKCLVDCLSKVDSNAKPGGKIFKQLMIDYSLWLSWRIAKEWGLSEVMIIALKQQHQRAVTQDRLSQILTQSNICSEIRMLVIAKKLPFKEGKRILEELNLPEAVLVPIYKEIELLH